MSETMKYVLFVLGLLAILMIAIFSGYRQGCRDTKDCEPPKHTNREIAYYNWYYAEVNVRYYTEVTKTFKNSKELKSLMARWITLRDKWNVFYPKGYENLTREIEKQLYVEMNDIERHEHTPVLPDIMFKVQEELDKELFKNRIKRL